MAYPAQLRPLDPTPRSHRAASPAPGSVSPGSVPPPAVRRRPLSQVAVGRARPRRRRRNRRSPLAALMVVVLIAALVAVGVRVLVTQPSARRQAVVQVQTSPTPSPPTPTVADPANGADPAAHNPNRGEPAPASGTSGAGASSTNAGAGSASPSVGLPLASSSSPSPGGGSVAPKPTGSSPTPSPTSTPTNPPTPASNVTSREVVTRGDGATPTLAGGTLNTSITGQASPQKTSYSVMVMSGQGDSPDWTTGDRMKLDYDVKLNLGDSVNDNSGWLVITEAWGPSASGDTASAWSLGVRQGQWRVEGGEWNRGQQWLRGGLLPYQDKKTWHVSIETLFDSSASTGRLKVSLDGRVILNEALPTLLPENRNGVQMFLGLSAGEQTGLPAPTYTRTAVYSSIVMKRS